MENKMPIRKVPKTFTTFTTLRNTNEIDRDDFEQSDIEHLKDGEADGVEVEVVCKATDGYFDIEFEDGYVIYAISWYYLDGYTDDSEE
jgi:hypothetical protein